MLNVVAYVELKHVYRYSLTDICLDLISPVSLSLWVRTCKAP
jgi:hypothetical protein